MKQRMSSEFIYQLFALLIAVIVVHAVYVGAIRPAADAQIKREMALQAAGEDYVPERTFAVVIRDFEQEACFILLIWALAIMGYKGRRTLNEQSLLDRRLTPLLSSLIPLSSTPSTPITPSLMPLLPTQPHHDLQLHPSPPSPNYHHSNASL